MSDFFIRKALKTVLLAVTVFFSIPFNNYAQLTVSPSHTAAQLAAKLAGPGVTIVADSLICNNLANGTFVSSGTLLAIDSGIILSTGKAADASGAEAPLTSTGFGGAGDADLTSFLGTTTNSFDACELILYVVPKGDTISFKYQFGSEEYRQSTCGNYDDAFAFFISGPGITTTLPGVNMALVPGTNIPVAVNTINSGTPGTTTGCNIANCNAYGTGSPFTSYFIDNTGGSQVSYRGYTQLLTAMHAVTPCDTYRIKMSIVDAGNDIYDSGVFIEGGSLTTNSFHFSRVDSVGSTVSGIPHSIIRGCSPTTVKVVGNTAVATNQVLLYRTSGTAISGVDYTPLSDTVIIPAGSSSGTFTVQALTSTTPGTKTLTFYLQAPNGCGILDSLVITIQDPPTASIFTPDTTVCANAAVFIRVTGTAGLSYSWSPATGLDYSNIQQPTSTLPGGSTTYYMTATLPGSGCPAIYDSVTISHYTFSVAILTGDTSVCPGARFQIRVSGNDSFTYSWSPATYLDNPNTKQPYCTPLVSTSYVLTTVTTNGCTLTSNFNVHTANLNAIVTSKDTAICRGNIVQVFANGDTAGVTYQWIPTAGIAVSNVLNPLVAPDTSATYYLIGNAPGCTRIIDSVKIDVQPNPIVNIGNNRFLCQYDTFHIHTNVTPSWYNAYSYRWSPATNLDDTTTPNVVFTAGSSQELYVTVRTTNGCKTIDSIYVTVNPGNFLTINANVGICPHDSVQLHAGSTEGGNVLWSPSLYLDDSTSPNPWVHAITSTAYTLIGTSTAGCHDTAHVSVTVWPNASIYMIDSATIFEGESYTIQMNSNCNTFKWFPPYGLNDDGVMNPVATPSVSTKYFVTGITQNGCVAHDSIDIVFDENSVVSAPNAFTPDGTTNRTFNLNLMGQSTLNYFRVFDRWGVLVYETKNTEQGWDGNYNGKPQPQGVYIFVIQAVSKAGIIYNKKGNVTLLR